MINVFSITREEPLFRKCCYCIPLRLCLQTWAYIKIVADTLALSYLILVIAILHSYDHRAFIRKLSIIHPMCLLAVALVVDVGFLVALVAGIFKKSYNILRVFYLYEFYAMTVETVLVTIVCVNILLVEPAAGALYTVIGILYIMLHVCITMTVKSELIKLRNKEQYNFSRMQDSREDGEGIGKFHAERESLDA